MPVMSTSNIRVKNIYDTMEFVFEKIENYGEDYVFQVDNERLTRKIFQSHSYHRFA